jgi:hypothetical protein
MKTPLAHRLFAPPAAELGPSLRVLVASLTIGAVYFGASRGVENFFPFTVLDMYANPIGAAPSRILAVDARGAAHEVDEYAGWRCASPIEGNLGVCPDARDAQHLGYVDRSAVDHIRAHPGGGGGESLRLVRRVWRLVDREGPPPSVDCPISVCRAVRR